jgi:hypothetical protein
MKHASRIAAGTLLAVIAFVLFRYAKDVVEETEDQRIP